MWGYISSDNVDVRDVKVWVATAGSVACVSPEPVVGGFPVAKGECHTVSNVIGHVRIVSTVSIHRDSVSTLAQSDNEVSESSTTLIEIDLVVEVSGGIDLASWSVCPAELILGVLPARS